MPNLEKFMNTITIFFVPPSLFWSLADNKHDVRSTSHVTKSHTLQNRCRTKTIPLLGVTMKETFSIFLTARVGSTGLEEVLNTNSWLEKFWTLNSSLFICQ